MKKTESEIIRFRVSSALHAEITARAEKLGVRPSEVARLALAQALVDSLAGPGSFPDNKTLNDQKDNKA